MPGFNQTGPVGHGPNTGRCRGLCTRPQAAIRSAPGRGLGYGRGRGFNRGFRNGRCTGYSFEDLLSRENYQTGDYQLRTDGMRVEIDRLQSQAESMQRSLDALNERIAAIGKSE